VCIKRSSHLCGKMRVTHAMHDSCLTQHFSGVSTPNREFFWVSAEAKTISFIFIFPHNLRTARCSHAWCAYGAVTASECGILADCASMRKLKNPLAY
jgi:hypothetical protein